MNDMLLIFPPVARACEPPAGIARLAGALRSRGFNCRLLDANLEVLLWLIGEPSEASDTWTRRAILNRSRHLAALRETVTYRSSGRYSRCVIDLNRLLNVAGKERGAVVEMADVRYAHLSPLRSADLISSAEHYEHDPFFPWFRRRLPELLDGVGTVGFSLNYLSQALPTFAMTGFIRAYLPAMSIMIGGGLITSWMRRPGWKSPFGGLIDTMVAGPGETQLLSTFGMDDGRGSCTKPDFSGLPLDLYLSPGLVVPYSAASGCYWSRCSFCPEVAEGNSYHPVPTRLAIAELEELVAAHSPVLIHLLDNAINPTLLNGMMETPPGAPWYGFVRFSGELADLDYCIGLKRSGCVMLKLGLESGDQGVLDRLRKGIELGTVSRAIANLKQVGIGVYLYLLFGTPAETEKEARHTLEFVVRNRESIDFLNLALFNMPVSCNDAAKFTTEPFYDGDLSLYTGFRHPQGWERKDVRRFLEREFKREPAVAEILRRDPPLFSSSHAPFFC